MSIKAVILLVLALTYAYRLMLAAVEKKSCSNPIPESVADVYDAETYARWRSYSAEKLKNQLYQLGCEFAVSMLMLGLNVYAKVAVLFSANVYMQLFVVLVVNMLEDIVFQNVFAYIDTMIIEQKYGFNRTTIKTFVSDQIKSTIISLVLMTGLISVLAAIHTWLGDWMLVVFTAVMFALIMAITFLYPFFTKIFNKFTDLEEGELKEKLTALLTKNGYHVRGIKVMDASRRSTKSNAYFTGFGKTKTIVLYDTLIQNMTTDEICAVFAHEMGHGIHKDTTKNQIFSLINVFMIALVMWLVVRTPQFHTAFGFETVNYGFAMIIGVGIGFQLVAPLFGILTSLHSRKAEYRADAQAVTEGYGRELVSALKKLSRENFSHLAPSKLIVILEYSHPPLAQRISAIEKQL